METDRRSFILGGLAAAGVASGVLKNAGAEEPQVIQEEVYVGEKIFMYADRDSGPYVIEFKIPIGCRTLVIPNHHKMVRLHLSVGWDVGKSCKIVCVSFGNNIDYETFMLNPGTIIEYNPNEFLLESDTLALSKYAGDLPVNGTIRYRE